MTLSANTRMYNASPSVSAAWVAFVAATARPSGVGLEILEHPAPMPVEDFWAQGDLGW